MSLPRALATPDRRAPTTRAPTHRVHTQRGVPCVSPESTRYQRELRNVLNAKSARILLLLEQINPPHACHVLFIRTRHQEALPASAMTQTRDCMKRKDCTRVSATVVTSAIGIRTTSAACAILDTMHTVETTTINANSVHQDLRQRRAATLRWPVTVLLDRNHFRGRTEYSQIVLATQYMNF